MDRYWKTAPAGAPPTAPVTPSPGYPSPGNPGAGIPASRPGAWWYHMVTEELRQAIVNAGLTPDYTNVGQLSQAIVLLSPSVAPGATVAFARNTAPTGWLKANGAAVSRTTYAALFAAIGTTFGVGDGSTTFNVPDMRGEFSRGWDDGRNVDVGRAFGSAQESTIINQEVDSAHLIPLANSDGNVGNTSQSYAQTANSASTSGARHRIRPRNVALLYCIKT